MHELSQISGLVEERTEVLGSAVLWNQWQLNCYECLALNTTSVVYRVHRTRSNYAFEPIVVKDPARHRPGTQMFPELMSSHAKLTFVESKARIKS